MEEKITPYLRNKLTTSSISKQFIKSDDEGLIKLNLDADPLSEDSNEVVPGLIHKFNNRALIKVSYLCAAHCRFCTRYRQIGSKDGDMNAFKLKNIKEYLLNHKEITDVILSGGDPFYSPKATINTLEAIGTIKTIMVFRIGTRLPVQNPLSFKSKLINNLLDSVENVGKQKPFYILIQINHPDELSDETLSVIKEFRKRNLMVLSQTVFLKGVNNEYNILKNLFEKMYFNGIIPYYIYRCDYVYGAGNFICDFEEEKAIMTKLNSNLSGIACPTYVIDVKGHGKIPVPLNYWDSVDNSNCLDFKENKFFI